MTYLVKEKLFLILALLLTITFASWLLTFSTYLDANQIGVILLTLAFVKTRFIIIHYMEAAKAQPLVRFLFEGWVLLVGAITIVLYVT